MTTQPPPLHPIANRRLAPATYCTKPVKVKAMLVTESAEQADAIRSWLGAWRWAPNTDAMRPGCVLVRTSLATTEIAPPGWYVVRGADGQVQVVDPDTFHSIYSPVNGGSTP